MYANYAEFEKHKVACRDCAVGNIYDKVVCSDGCTIDPVIMVIGEGPGRDEVIHGKPFVGRAGKLLRSTINEFGFRTTNTVISNVIPCRPKDNKFPTDVKLVRQCVKKWLFNEIILLKPSYLLLLGNQPLKYVLGLTGITKQRGSWKTFNIDTMNIECMPTLHPSYVLRKQYMSDGASISKNFRDDIKIVAKRAGLIR